jgi:hypothetical protein
MKKIQTWFDVYEDGKKLIFNLPEFSKQYKDLKPGRYIYTIEKVENKRSLEQNNAMWALPYMYLERALKEAGILKETDSKREVHEWCMVNYLPNDYRERIYELWKQKEPIINYKTGEQYKQAFRLSTTLMTTKDSMNYYSAMQDGYAENFSSGEENDLIPDPDPDYKKKNKKSL